MTYPSHLIPTTVVGSYPQPDWLVDRAPARNITACRASMRKRHLAHPGAVARAGAGRRHDRRDPRDGARRHRHRHRRRDPPRELFEPLCARARRHRCRASRPGRAQRRRHDAGAARRRQDQAARPGRDARRRVPAGACDARDQDHAAGAVHAVAAGRERLLCRRGGDGDGLRRRGQRGTARAEGDRGRCRAARRALGAHRARRRRRAGASRRSTARSTASPARPSCICASATRRWCAASRPNTPSCRSSPTRRPSRSRSRRRSRVSISAC